MEQYVLYHHGVKGQKWGVRRYQQKDGSLTAAGKKRYGDSGFTDTERAYYKTKDELRRSARPSSGEAKRTTLASKEMDEANKESKIREKYDQYNPSKTKALSDAVNDTASNVNRLSDIERRTRPAAEIKKMDLSNMSDQQLREEINRAMLEKQYNEMFAPRDEHKGRQTVGKILEVGGAILGIAGTALGIAVAIKDLSGK